MSRILICTMGLPKSGKSTWAREQPWPIVSPDSIRIARRQMTDAPKEPWVWAVAYTMVESLFLSGHDVVLFDSCAWTLRSRDELRKRRWDCKFKFLDTSLDICISRADNPKLVDIVLRMHKNIQPLGLEENVHI